MNEDTITVWFPAEEAMKAIGIIQTDYLFKRGCENKRAYKSRLKALKDRAHFIRNELGAKELHSYRCYFCGKWHLGHPSKSKRL